MDGLMEEEKKKTISFFFQLEKKFARFIGFCLEVIRCRESKWPRQTCRFAASNGDRRFTMATLLDETNWHYPSGRYQNKTKQKNQPRTVQAVKRTEIK